MIRQHFYKNLSHNCSGFTFIELLAGIAIAGILGTVLIMSLFQITGVSESNKNRLAAINQLENALQAVNRDVQVANLIETAGSSASGFPFTLQLKTWENKNIKIIYSLENGNMIRRYFENDMINPQSTNLLAYSVDTSVGGLTWCTFVNNLFTLKITVTIGIIKPISVDRTIRVSPRSVNYFNR